MIEDEKLRRLTELAAHTIGFQALAEYAKRRGLDSPDIDAELLYLSELRNDLIDAISRRIVELALTS